MNLVVDASVAVKWFVRENLSEVARELLRSQDALLAPDLIVAEVTNIAWKKVVRGEIKMSQAEAIAASIRQGEPALHPSTDFNGRALEIALSLNHSVYDCLYLACAERVGGILVTADRHFCDGVSNSEFAPLVRRLGNPSATPRGS